MTISALCIFSGDSPENNPDAAAEALRAAGYQVFRLPPELKATIDESVKEGLNIEGDDFIEVRREGDDVDAMEADAERIVSPLGGAVDCCGPACMETFSELRGDGMTMIEELRQKVRRVIGGTRSVVYPDKVADVVVLELTPEQLRFAAVLRLRQLAVDELAVDEIMQTPKRRRVKLRVVE